MGVATITPPASSEKIRHLELPIIDLMAERSEVAKQIVKACEEFGFFKVINHGVSHDIITKMEEESFEFFAKPSCIKQQAGPANPYGYGCKNIGFNGDKGEVEYLLLHANPSSISEISQTISSEPLKFRSTVNDYVKAVRELACEILEVMAEGLWVQDTLVFSKLIKDNHENDVVETTDSLFRLNYYPPLMIDSDTSPSSLHHHHHHDPNHHYHHHHNLNNNNNNNSNKIGFGEHTDPQILTLLRSNDVSGLQISLEDGVWVPVTPHPTAFCVNVGDVLQAMTNGKFVSVKHRALVNSYKARLSMAYFAAPSLQSRITPIPELVKEAKLYRSFTWGEYKKATYSRRLGDSRLTLFTAERDDESRELLATNSYL